MSADAAPLLALHHVKSQDDRSQEVATDKEPLTEWSPCEYCFA